MQTDLRLIAPNALQGFTTAQSAAFSAACLSILNSQMKGFPSGGRSATEALAARIGYAGMVDDVISVLDCCARGLTAKPSQQLVSDAESAVLQGQRLKETEGKYRDGRRYYGANTVHLYAHIPLQVALSCLEAARLNPFQTMTCVTSCLKTSAVYSCDGDPSGAVNIEIQDAMSEAIPAIRRAFCYVRARGPTATQPPCFFPRGFLSEIAEFGDLAVSEDDLLSDSEVARGESPTRDGPPQRRREASLPEVQGRFSYQVFISFKNFDANGRPTEDAALAEELYRFLSEKGIVVFFSNLSLEKLGQSAFSKAIDRALDSSQILIAVATEPAHLESEWVRYEWDSFFNDIISGIKPNGRVFSYVRGVEAHSLPRKLRQNQVFHDDRGERENLCSFISNALI